MDCPSLEKLRAYLESDPADPADLSRPEIEAHLESCSRCQSHLDEFTAWREPLVKMATSETTKIATAAVEAAPSLDIPDCRITSRLGQGGMGIVYQGIDLTLDRTVAIKVLLSGDADIERRFLEEVHICSQLQHPGIVPVHRIGRLKDGRPFFVMKQVKGKTLAALLNARRDPGDDLIQFLNYFKQVCETLAYAHSRNVIHRDLKPANIMVGAFGEVQVMDWGLAKLVGQTQSDAESEQPRTTIKSRRDIDGFATDRRTVLGTCAFMSPEQATGEIDKIGPRSDVFALGAILCVLLTGKPPYEGPNDRTVLFMAMEGRLADVHDRLDRSGMDSDLVALAKSCLTPAQRDRPAADAVAHAIGAYLDGVREKLRQAELARVAASATAVEERKRRRLTLGFSAAIVLALLLAGWAWWRSVEGQLAAAKSTHDQAEAVALRAAGDRKEAKQRWEALRQSLATLAASLEKSGANEDLRRDVRTRVKELDDAASAALRDIPDR
jgi:eukaryotic-like serine/threonine-protein kinase